MDVNTAVSFATQVRHMSHRFPRLSDDEHFTAERLVNELTAFLSDHGHHQTACFPNIGGAGVVCVTHVNSKSIDGCAEELRGRHVVLLRAELDGLPIDETHAHHIPAAWRSQVPGVSMKCGHDGHHASMLGAFALSAITTNYDATKGAVALLLQPSEETGYGARRVIDDPKFRGLFQHAATVTPISYHNVPGLPLGAMHCRVGVFSKASTGFVAHFRGAPAHAAEPQNGVSPVSAVANAALRLANVADDLSPEAAALATITHVNVGEATFGVAPGEAKIHITMRANRWKGGVDALIRTATSIATAVVEENNSQKHESKHVALETETCDEFIETANHEMDVATFFAAAKECDIASKEMVEPNSWSEDFGLILQHYGRGAMVALGAGGECPALHTVDYDFPDALLEVAVRLFSTMPSMVIKANV